MATSSDVKDPDIILSALLAAYPAAEDGRWTKITEEFTKEFGEFKSTMWLKNRAKKLEKVAAQTLTTDQDRNVVLEAAAQDIVLPKEVRGCVRVFTGDRGRGLQCTRDVSKGEVLIGIPKKWALDVPASSTGGNSGQIQLATHLISLRDKNDFRVRHLPESSDMPCFWSDEELAWLRGSYCYEPACNQRSTLQSLFPGRKAAGCTETDFMWGMCMVQSRTFGVTGTMIFLPFIDLINSEAAPDLALDIRQADNYVNIHATRDFKEGEEALVSYHGKEPPSLFQNFLGYGFVPPVVSYPLPPIDEKAELPELMDELQRWEEHLHGLQDGDSTLESLKDAASIPLRRKIAAELIKHERKMSVEQIDRIKLRISDLQR